MGCRGRAQRLLRLVAGTTGLGCLANADLVHVTESIEDVAIEQIDRGGKVYQIPVSLDEYYLIENRQSDGSYYNRNIPGSGLLLWHVDERSDNDEETHKQLDLVCADGSFSEGGFPGVGEADPASGGDNLDFWLPTPPTPPITTAIAGTLRIPSTASVLRDLPPKRIRAPVPTLAPAAISSSDSPSRTFAMRVVV